MSDQAGNHTEAGTDRLPWIVTRIVTAYMSWSRSEVAINELESPLCQTKVRRLTPTTRSPRYPCNGIQGMDMLP